MSTKDTLNFVSRQVHIYYGLSILIVGVIGGVLNVIIFTTLRTFRETTCAFYLTAVSVVNVGQLLTALLARVLSDGFQIDIRKISWVCKSQIYVVTWSVLVSMTGMCLAAVDQCLSMSKYRHLCNLRLAQRAILFTCIFWSIYCICLLFYWDVPFGTCTITNSSFALYTSRFHIPVLVGFLPICTMITFSVLAFYNARKVANQPVNIVRSSRDRQLTAMTLIHVMFVVITVLPYIIYVVYSLNQTITDSEQLARSNFIYTITVLIDYSAFAGSFYIYCCVSERFRKQLVYVMRNVFIDRWRQRLNNWKHNQIVPNT